jgi:RIO-like serine/threonine protein kinase
MARADIPDVVVLKAVQRYQLDHTEFANQLLAKWTGEPIKVCDRAMERAMDHDLIEYGVSLRSAWLTPKGKQLLAQHEAQPATYVKINKR